MNLPIRLTFSPALAAPVIHAQTATQLWENRHSGPVNSDNHSPALGVDASGNVIVTGYSVANSTSDYYTAKYAAADGALLWEKSTVAQQMVMMRPSRWRWTSAAS